MHTPKAFTPAYGPNDEKVVWTLDGDSVLRNSEHVFDLGSVTAARLHGSKHRADRHRFEIVADDGEYLFTTGYVHKVDTDGWHWFTVSVLRRLQAIAPDLQVDVRTIYADPVVAGIWAFYAIGFAILVIAAVFLRTENWSGFASFLVYASLPCAFIVALRVRRWRHRLRENRASAVPEDAANLVIARIRRRYCY